MTHLPTVLLSGFEPFGGDLRNSSWDAARGLNDEIIAGHRVTSVCLPVTFCGALPRLFTAIQSHQPRLVIAVGQANSRCRISIERVALNLIDARIADNEGQQPVDVAIEPEGPAACFSTLPIKRVYAALKAAGFPVELSHSAGTFVCNQVFYGLLRHLPADVRCGFIHIPYGPEQAADKPGAPSMAATLVMDALRQAIETCLGSADDLHFAAGSEC
jgi:pyroglutamyl-peptidase